MNTALIAPVMMASMNPNNYLPRKDQYRKPARARKKEEKKSLFNLDAAQYVPTDTETRMREFYATYGK